VFSDLRGIVVFGVLRDAPATRRPSDSYVLTPVVRSAYA
jgi:hypothetical protein